MDGITGRNGHDGIEVLRKRTVKTAGNIISRWEGRQMSVFFSALILRRKIWN